MIPSVVATQIRNCVSDYLRTTFRPTTSGFEGLMDRFLSNSENFYQGPYISIEPIWDLSASKSLEHESNETEIEFSRGIV